MNTEPEFRNIPVPGAEGSAGVRLRSHPPKEVFERVTRELTEEWTLRELAKLSSHPFLLLLRTGQSFDLDLDLSQDVAER